jgi:transposase
MKNSEITRNNTRNRRKIQDCKVFELKFDKSHLSKNQKEWLKRAFLEAKWYYNYILSTDDVFKFDTKIKDIKILNKDKIVEDRKIETLSAQMIQGIKDQIMFSIKSLSSLRNKNIKIGKLKFKSCVNSIYLKQFKQTYRIINDKYIKIEKMKGKIKANGLKQIPKNAEITCANLICKAGDYYLKVTCFVPKEEKIKKNNAIGLDFGIKTSITDSEGNKYNFNFPETKAIKKASKKVNKCKLGSNNRFKARVKRQKAYEKNNCIKKDAKNKFISKLKKNYDVICVQNENIKAWHKSKLKGHGRRVQHSIMGGIIAELKKNPATIIVDRFYPSTKLCPKCGKLNKTTLSDRIYYCECGYSCDRDTHSARNILNEGLKFSMEYRKPMPVEEKPLICCDLTNQADPLKQEASKL